MKTTLIHWLARASLLIDSPDVVDQLDDLFGQPVAGRGLSGKDIRSRRRGLAAILDQRQIFVDDVHHIEQLPLVSVDALHLNIEERIRIDV